MRFGQLQRCDCGQADAGVRAGRHARAKQQLGDELAEKADCTFATFDLERPLAPVTWRGETVDVAAQRHLLRQAHAVCAAYAADWRGWVYLHGTCGAGKSHLAAALAHVALEGGQTVLYRSVPGLMDAVRAASGEDLLRTVLATEVLVVDDLGAAQLSGWMEEKVFRLFNERLGRPLIITANLAPEDLPARLRSRLARAKTRVVWMPLADYATLEGGGW